LPRCIMDFALSGNPAKRRGRERKRENFVDGRIGHAAGQQPVAIGKLVHFSRGEALEKRLDDGACCIGHTAYPVIDGEDKSNAPSGRIDAKHARKARTADQWPQWGKTVSRSPSSTMIRAVALPDIDKNLRVRCDGPPGREGAIGQWRGFAEKGIAPANTNR